MCQLLETIKLENGELKNLFYHNLRLNAARIGLFNVNAGIQLEKEIRIPHEYQTGLHRCRVTFSRTIDKIEFIPVHPRSFLRLKAVHHDLVDYQFKFADRTLLNELYAQRENADEIIIIKNGLVTDCTIGNLVFFTGTEWLTPDTPLLKGTQRQALLDRKLIMEKRISETDLFSFQQAGIINALYDLESMPMIKTENIFY